MHRQTKNPKNKVPKISEEEYTKYVASLKSAEEQGAVSPEKTAETNNGQTQKH